MKQKLFTLFLALVASVGTTFAARDVVPSDAVLKNYYKTGQLCVCIFVPAEMACNDVVFVGTYNRDASGAWITDVKTLAKFEPVEGYDGWYVIAVNDETPADFQDKGIQGKPVILDRDGNFNWAYQVGDVTVIRGGVTVVDGYVGEIDLVKYTKDVPNVFTIDALKANANPCTAVYHDYTFTVISDGCEGFAVPYLVGSMTDWGFQQMQVNVEKTQELGAPVYYYKCRCAEGTRYQVLSGLKAADGAIIEQPTWDAISYLEQLVDDVWGRYTENGNVDLTTGANVNITFDVRQKNLRWARCAAPEEAYEVAVSLTAPAGAPSAVEIIGEFDGWTGMAMTLANGVYTATVTATASQVFKFREAGTWENEIMIADETVEGGWKEFPTTQFQSVWEPAAEKGKMVINLDLSNPAMYRWKETQTISGTCGDNLTWTLVDSVLTISGTGAMADYTYNTMPWYEYRSSIKSVIITDGVTSIGDAAFSWCSFLTSVTIPNSVTRIEKSAFEGCKSLTSVTIPNSVTSIVWYAFKNCSSLTSITIPNSVTSIGDEAFCSCESLTSVTIPNSVTRIGKYAFYDCSSLTSVTIPNSVTSIGDEAFGYCSKLTSVTINSDAIVNTSSSNLSDIFGSQVTEYIIGDNVKGIGNYAFHKCSSLTSVTIGNSVTSIGKYAFRYCESLTSVTIGNSVTSIGEGAFYFCSSLTSVHITDIAAWCNIDFEDYSANPLSSAHNLYLNGELVKDLVIPNSVTSIGEYAFYGCTSLTSITIPNSVTSIGWGAFCNCSSLTSVTIGNSVTSIGGWAFRYCESLTSITIPNSVTSIGSYAFSDCPSITSVTIPNSVTSIGSSAFAGCTSLKSITIPNSITSLYNNTFANCTSLNEIILPASIISIGANVFAGCTKLYDVYCYAMEPPTAYESSFANYNAFLHVPCECQRVYLLDVLFGNFKYIECISSDNTTTDEIVVTPSENEANVIWPTVSGAASYELVVKDKSGNIVCTLIFNANGQLTSIAFNAPSRNGAPAQTQSAGFSFTVTGLDSGTGYDLTLTAKDNSGNAIQTETISFITTGGNISTDMNQVQSDQVQSTKVIRDGQVLILRNGKTYTMQGQEVK